MTNNNNKKKNYNENFFSSSISFMQSLEYDVNIIFTLSQISSRDEEHTKYNKQLCLAFIDYEKTFDLVILV